MATNIEALDAAYDFEMVRLFGQLDSLKELVVQHMAAPDETAAEDGLIHWGHVGDLKRINAMLVEVADVIKGSE